MKRIELTTPGVYALVDDDDYGRLVEHNWWLNPDGYAKSKISGKTTSMNGLILQPDPGLETDHINHDNLDNRRANLRICTPSQNQANTKKRPGCSSRFKGVSWEKRECKWQAYIKVNGKQRNLGHFTDEQDAARAYDEAARQMFGEFALCNFEQLYGAEGSE